MAAAAILVWDQLDARHGTDAKRLGFALALGCALVWSTYSVASRLLAAVPSEAIAVVLPGDGRARLRLQPRSSSNGPCRPTAPPGSRCVGLGLGPVGAAFLLWDIGMKGGSVPLLGVLSYASPILSTACWCARPRRADLVAGSRLRADGAGGGRRHARRLTAT